MAAICVFCASSEAIDPSYVALAAQVGARVAAGGHSLVTGGGRVSMMGAVASAARAGGAHTLGVIPQALVDAEQADQDADELVVVATMRERKQLMDSAADAFIALPGGIGTFEEFFEVWTSASLAMHAKPVVLLDTDGFYDPLFAWLRQLTSSGFVRQSALDGLNRVGDVEKAFALIESLTAARDTIEQ